MKKSLYFLSLVLASQGFVSFLPAPNGWEESGHNDANGPAPASNPVYGSMELGDVRVNFQSQNSLAAGSFVAAAASLHSYLKGRPKTVEKLAQASLQQMLHGPGALWGNSAPKLVGYKSHEDLTYLNVGISEQPSLSVMPAPASSGRPLAPFPRTSGQFSAAPPPPVPFVPNTSPTNNQTLAPFADFSSNHVNSFKPEDGYGVYESAPGLPESLHPVVLSPSGNQQFDHSQTSTLDTGRQNITEENPDMKSAPPPPPPPPPPVPDSGGGAKSPSTAGEKESGKEGDSRGDLLQAIQEGITLKRVDDSQKTSWAKRQEEEENARRRRREEKKQSKQSELRSEAPKKDSASTTSPDQKSEPTESIAKIMQKAMAARSTAIQMSDREDEGNETDDESWSDEDDSSTPPSSRTSVPSASKLLSRSVSFISNASSNKSAEQEASVANPPKTPVANTPTSFVDDLRKSQANRASSSTLVSAESTASIADQIDKDRKDKIRQRTQSEAGNLAPWQKERMEKQQSKK